MCNNLIAVHEQVAGDSGEEETSGRTRRGESPAAVSLKMLHGLKKERREQRGA